MNTTAGRIALLFGLFAFTICLNPPPARSGPFDKLKKKVEQKATEKAEEGVDKAADKASGTTEGAAGDEEKASEEQTGSAGSQASGGMETSGEKVSAVSTKFDYVPGDKVIFMDDFTQDELGEFPARWKLSSGTFEVAERDGERWMRCVSTDGRIAMSLSGVEALPEYWTLEFDADNLDGAGNTLTVSGLSTKGDPVWETIFPYSGHNVFFRTGEITSDTPTGGEVAGRHRFMFMARGKALKVYVDRERVANIPDVSGSGVAAKIDFRLWSPEKPMLTNVRFAEGCRPAKDMLAEGKLVTYGIHFATGSDVVQPESAPVLRQIGGYLGANPGVRLMITGHTDNVGKAPANLDLSKRRAASVAEVLASQFGVARDRFETDGKGDTQPLSSNANPEGRAMNRRVEFAKLGK